MGLASRRCRPEFAGQHWACPHGHGAPSEMQEATQGLLLSPGKVPICVGGRVLVSTGRAGDLGQVLDGAG